MQYGLETLFRRGIVALTIRSRADQHTNHTILVVLRPACISEDAFNGNGLRAFLGHLVLTNRQATHHSTCLIPGANLPTTHCIK